MGRMVWTTIVFAAALFASEGEGIYMAKGCYGCHGSGGEGVNNYPRLACRPQSELMARLHALRKGAGHTPEEDLMVPFAKALSEKEMEAVTRYLSRLCEKREEEKIPDYILGGNNGD